MNIIFDYKGSVGLSSIKKIRQGPIIPETKNKTWLMLILARMEKRNIEGLNGKTVQIVLAWPHTDIFNQMSHNKF